MNFGCKSLNNKDNTIKEQRNINPQTTKTNTKVQKEQHKYKKKTQLEVCGSVARGRPIETRQTREESRKAHEDGGAARMRRLKMKETIFELEKTRCTLPRWCMEAWGLLSTENGRR